MRGTRSTLCKPHIGRQSSQRSRLRVEALKVIPIHIYGPSYGTFAAPQEAPRPPVAPLSFKPNEETISEGRSKNCRGCFEQLKNGIACVKEFARELKGEYEAAREKHASTGGFNDRRSDTCAEGSKSQKGKSPSEQLRTWGVVNGSL